MPIIATVEVGAEPTVDDPEVARLRLALRQVPPPPSYPRPLSLTPVLVSPVAPRQTQALLAALAVSLPLPDELAHLKRVRRSGKALSMLLCDAAAWGEMPAAVREDLALFELAPETHDVPAESPESASELAAWNIHWPCILRARRPPPPPLNASELLSAAHHLRAAITLADSVLPPDAPAAAILVDPETDEVVAAEMDRAGRGRDQAGPGLIEHAAMRVVSAAAAPHLAGDDARRAEARYLATGLDCYLSREPCAMCAMALLHARIRRVFFARPAAGVARLSVALVHCEPRLNHRYRAFCLPESALAAVKDDDPPPEKSFCRQV